MIISAYASILPYRLRSKERRYWAANRRFAVDIHMLTWRERSGVGYIVGIIKNDALLRCIREPMGWVGELARRTGEKQREFFQFYAAVGTWKGRRKVIAKLEVTNQGKAAWKVENKAVIGILFPMPARQLK